MWQLHLTALGISEAWRQIAGDIRRTGKARGSFRRIVNRHQLRRIYFDAGKTPWMRVPRTPILSHEPYCCIVVTPSPVRWRRFLYRRPCHRWRCTGIDSVGCPHRLPIGRIPNEDLTRSRPWPKPQHSGAFQSGCGFGRIKDVQIHAEERGDALPTPSSKAGRQRSGGILFGACAQGTPTMKCSPLNTTTTPRPNPPARLDGIHQAAVPLADVGYSASAGL